MMDAESCARLATAVVMMECFIDSSRDTNMLLRHQPLRLLVDYSADNIDGPIMITIIGIWCPILGILISIFEQHTRTNIQSLVIES